MTALQSHLLIFDLDGTLVDSAGDICAAVNILLESLGRPFLPVETVRGMVGEGAKRLVEKALAASPGPTITVEAAHERFIALYAEMPVAHTRLYPGVRETLDRLAAAGATLAICTNKPSAPTANVLKALGLEAYFAAIVTGDSLPVRKPDPDTLDHLVRNLGAGKDRFLLVGDSEIDAATALAAGMPFALLTYGYRHSPVEAIPARFRVDRFADLETLLPLQRPQQDR